MNTSEASSRRPVALVTGASSGIGEAIARRLAEEGHQVHVAARRAERLEALAESAGCVPHVIDLHDHAAVVELIERIGPLDVLVNNAGRGSIEPLAHSDSSSIIETVDLNVTSLLVACSAALPGMIEQRRGIIVNVGSMAGLYPVPAALYGATKGAVHRLCTDLRLELQGTGIRVTEICPGRVATEFYDAAIGDAAVRSMTKESNIVEVTANEVADAIYYAIDVPPHVNINRIELQPTEQTYGGSQFVPAGG